MARRDRHKVDVLAPLPCVESRVHSTISPPHSVRSTTPKVPIPRQSTWGDCGPSETQGDAATTTAGLRAALCRGRQSVYNAISKPADWKDASGRHARPRQPTSDPGRSGSQTLRRSPHHHERLTGRLYDSPLVDQESARKRIINTGFPTPDSDVLRAAMSTRRGDHDKGRAGDRPDCCAMRSAGVKARPPPCRSPTCSERGVVAPQLERIVARTRGDLASPHSLNNVTCAALAVGSAPQTTPNTPAKSQLQQVS